MAKISEMDVALCLGGSRTALLVANDAKTKHENITGTGIFTVISRSF